MSTYAAINIHLIFATKGRAPMIAPAWRQDLHNYIGGTLRGLEAKSLAIGGVADHVHILASLKTSHCIADLVRQVKKSSGDFARQNYYAFAWQVGYAAIAVSPNDVAMIAAYIAKQEEHHKAISSEDELRQILMDAGIEIDERYFE